MSLDLTKDVGGYRIEKRCDAWKVKQKYEKSILVETFTNHCESVLHTLKYHLLYSTVKKRQIKTVSERTAVYKDVFAYASSWYIEEYCEEYWS